MSIFTTSDSKVLMPQQVADGMVKQSQSLSTVAKLSGAEPTRFGEVKIVIFNQRPRAEFVEEGGEKGSTTGAFGSVTAVPHKAQVTMRFSDEVQWADEDHQLGVFKELAEAGKEALSRALDLGLYHRINPLTGNEISGWSNYATASTKRVEIGAGSAEVDDDFRAAVGLVVNDTNAGAQVTGAAFDPKFAWALANLKARDGAGATSQLRYPQLGFGQSISDFMGIETAVGNTVSGVPEAADTKVRAIVGDFKNGIRWGVQRELPVELIRFGDPDGQGDLKRKNQIALRLEMVYAWYVFADRFAIIEDKN